MPRDRKLVPVIRPECPWMVAGGSTADLSIIEASESLPVTASMPGCFIRVPSCSEVTASPWSCSPAQCWTVRAAGWIHPVAGVSSAICSCNSGSGGVVAGGDGGRGGRSNRSGYPPPPKPALHLRQVLLPSSSPRSLSLILADRHRRLFHAPGEFARILPPLRLWSVLGLSAAAGLGAHGSKQYPTPVYPPSVRLIHFRA